MAIRPELLRFWYSAIGVRLTTPFLVAKTKSPGSLKSRMLSRVATRSSSARGRKAPTWVPRAVRWASGSSKTFTP